MLSCPKRKSLSFRTYLTVPNTSPSSHAFSAQTVFELIKHQHAEASAPLLLSHNGTSGEGSGTAINTNGLRISTLYGEYALPEGMAADSSDYIR